jgi:hypothetical protein
LRGDHGGRIVTWRAEVTRVAPDTGQWREIAPALAAKRLNSSGDAGSLVARWAAECAVTRLSPVGEPVEADTTLPAGALAEPPRETPARHRARIPFHLHRVRRPR